MQCGWHGSLQDLLDAAESDLLDSLAKHYIAVFNQSPSSSQVDAWRDSLHILSRESQRLSGLLPEALGWTAVFEYELPREGGRRPDLVILTERSIVVIEFKEKEVPDQADIDQTSAYARDIESYHEESHGHEVIPILLPTRMTQDSIEETDGVRVISPHGLADLLVSLPCHNEVRIDPQKWIGSDYAPLPSLVEAARRIFRREPLPFIKRAQAARINEVVDHLVSVAEAASKKGERHLVLLTGVPGAGKTLVGLKFVYEHHFDSADGPYNQAVFLSGNGPLVEVLQYALKSTVFVQPMRDFIKQYGIKGGYPKEHVLVFDEAQRAWDADHVREKHGELVSEPDMLIQIGERLPGWAMILGLVGEGQEIHIGEEAGITQWNQAILKGHAAWHIHGPRRLRSDFGGASEFREEELLDLSTSLRTHLAEDVQEWIGCLLSGDIKTSAKLSTKMRYQGFYMYMTHSLEKAKEYATARYKGEPFKRYGLLASSKARNLPKYGVQNDFMTTRRLKVGQWYNDPPEEKDSCCSLTSVATEFACQGLELDLPIVCWGNDLWWQDDSWRTRRPSPLEKARDPHRLRLNAYRVLLSRGRDGFVIFMPPEQALMDTYYILLDAGVHGLPEAVAMVADRERRSS